jgi:hypothetical protein
VAGVVPGSVAGTDPGAGTVSTPVAGSGAGPVAGEDTEPVVGVAPGSAASAEDGAGSEAAAVDGCVVAAAVARSETVPPACWAVAAWAGNPARTKADSASAVAAARTVPGNRDEVRRLMMNPQWCEPA